MRKNSLVKYIGGQDKAGKKIFELKIGEVYTVNCYAVGIFPDGRKTVLKLEESGNIGFLKSMFVEVQPPMKIDLNEICKLSKYSILDSLN